MTLKSLISNGDFLTPTRANEWHLEPASFTLDNGTLVEVLDTGVIQFTPAHFGSKDIVLSSGIHGNETAPIEICDELIKHVITGQIKLAHRVLFIFGNPASMNIAKRFIEENLNRLFCGEHSKGQQNNEKIRASKLESYVSQFFNAQTDEKRTRIHYDLHTAIRDSKNEKFAVYPFLHGKSWKKEQLSFLKECGINTVLMMKSAATTFSYFSSHTFGADAFTIELGKVKGFGQNDMTRFTQAKQTLLNLITQDELNYPDFDFADFELFEVYRTINRTEENFSFTFTDEAANFTGFAKGELMAMDGNKRYLAEVDGEAIIFPNAKVAIGQRALLTVIPLRNKTHFV
jgi:succinylglutamate desuccinylase